MSTFKCMAILMCGLLFAACGKKDDSSTANTKTASSPAPPVASRDTKGTSPIPDPTPAAAWTLSVHDGNVATLVSPGKSPAQEVVRVDIKKALTPTGWHIQLNQAPLKVESHRRYSVSFRGRAQSTRNVFVGFARAHEPWTDLGLYRGLAMSPKWQTFQEEFVATADDNNARILFDLGGSDISVEFSDVKLSRLGDG